MPHMLRICYASVTHTHKKDSQPKKADNLLDGWMPSLCVGERGGRSRKRNAEEEEGWWGEEGEEVRRQSDEEEGDGGVRRQGIERKEVEKEYIEERVGKEGGKEAEKDKENEQ